MTIPFPTAPTEPVYSGPRRARLYLTRVDPWSVMKVSFVLSLMLGVIFTVATGILWWVLDSLGSFQKLSDVIASILGTGNFDLVQTMTLGHVLMFAGALSAFMCLMTVIVGTLVSYLYNLVTAFTGGVEYTLTQDY